MYILKLKIQGKYYIFTKNLSQFFKNFMLCVLISLNLFWTKTDDFPFYVSSSLCPFVIQARGKPLQIRLEHTLILKAYIGL